MGTLGSADACRTTPFDADEAAGRIPSHITLQSPLKDWPAANIQAGRRWTWPGRCRGEILPENYVRKLHRHLFKPTWKWAGTGRKTEKTIGIEPSGLAMALRDLLEDIKIQSDYQH